MKEAEPPEFTQKEEHPKEKLSDERLGNLLAAVGNSEAKAALLITMQPGFLYSAWKLHHDFIRAQGNNPGWIINSRGPLQFCENTFAPIGLVVKEVVDYGGSDALRYLVTRDGEELGKPLAGLLLDFSERARVPLINLFGSTNSAAETTRLTDKGEQFQYRERAPLRKFRIFYELITTGEVLRVTDLSQRVGSDTVSIGRDLVEMARDGLLSFDQAADEGPVSLYRIKQDKLNISPPQFSNYRTLTHSVWDLLVTDPNRYWSLREIREALHLATSSSYSAIPAVLAHFRREGFVGVQKFHDTSRSEAKLTPDQRAVLVQLVTIIDAFQNMDPLTLARGRNLANQIA
ncbi:MAG: hypothetical protein Q7J11_00620, partial [Candidatus Roizmanbacteria bacterium]|nr:hypothetical protein [Candidatus Roizmanbacteria bacterium]